MTETNDSYEHSLFISASRAAGGKEHEQGSGWSRREVLGIAGAAAGALMVPQWLPPATRAKAAARARAAASLTGGAPVRAAMHVHASWSEGYASWHAQFQQAAATGIDVLYLTDHDHRAMAFGYATSLSGMPWDIFSTGTFAQKATTASGGSVRVLAESASATAPAAVTMEVPLDTAARNRLHTSIAGTTVTQKITSAVLTNGATYEVAVTLSYHPAAAGRPAGQYKLVYRFGAGRTGHWTEGGGLTGVLGMPTPAAGSQQVLNLVKDVAAVWPDLVAMDNSFFGLDLTARSPKHGAVADVKVASMTFTRTQTSIASVIANQAAIVAAYRGAYPSVTAYPQTEISRHNPHLNTFGMAQWLPNYGSFSTDNNTLYRQLVDKIHSLGGIASYNHPLGFNDGPLLSASAQADKRRQVFASMHAVRVFGADVLEAGYPLRGQCNAATHIALWDAFSRDGTFLTGNGVTDDHHGQHWTTLANGFFTGIWAASRSDAALAAALRAGRAYTVHLGRYPGGEIDMLVDGAVPMGHVSVSSKTTRQLAMYVARVPSGASVQLIGGPVDYAGKPDPGTTVLKSFAASAFTSGTVTVPVSTSTDGFYRVQVVSPGGDVIGTGNPVWLLRQPPPTGIPASRR
jgi:hypothetical protein